MARTAPVPNIPPIPGMCPGIAVLAGGGGGGGAGGKGAGSGGGGTGAGGEGGAGDASGDSRNGGEACGDPVCPITGRVFVDVLDFGFSGPLPMRWIRSYSSRKANRFGDLGWGWSHPFSWSLNERRNKIEVIDDGGRSQLFPPHKGKEVSNPLGMKLRRDGNTWTLRDPRRGLSYTFEARASDPKRADLVCLADKYGNKTVLERDPQGLLQRLVDSAGRPYLVSSNQQGCIVDIKVATDPQHSSYMTVVRYEYDNAGDLISATDAEGCTYRQDYSAHLITAHHTPIGLSYCYRYDGVAPAAYCIESWGEYIGQVDPALEHPLPVRPRQGPDRRKIKGINYVKFFYDKDGRYTEVENGNGGITRYFGDEAGRVVKRISPSGGVREFNYDPEDGSLRNYSVEDGTIYAVDAGDDGVANGFVDSSGNGRAAYRKDGRSFEVDFATGAVTEHAMDARGDITFIRHPDGTTDTWELDARGEVKTHIARTGARQVSHYDAMGNCVREDESDGTSTRYEYDYLGRYTALIDSNGNRTEWQWNKRGDIVAKRLADGSEVRVTRDAIRRPTRIDDCGQVTTYEWGGFGWLIKATSPTGAEVVLQYDTEGNLTKVLDPRGQVTSQTFDPANRLTGCTTSEGHAHRIGWRSDDVITWIDRPNGREAFDYDATGALIAGESADGRAAELVYKSATEIHVTGDYAPLEREWDALGRVVRERQGSHENRVLWHGGRPAEITSDVGPTVSYATDLAGASKGVSAATGKIDLARWGDNQYVYHLGDKLVMRKRYDAVGCLRYVGIARRVEHVDPQTEATEHDPATLRWARYEFDHRHVLTSEYHSDGRSVSYETDAAGRATRRVVTQSDKVTSDEKLAYEPAGMPLIEGVHYDQHYRATDVNGERLHYDESGHLCRRETDAGTWEYDWDGQGHLVEVRAPTHRVEMDYDVYGRRLRKRVFRQNELTSDTSYVWNNNVLHHEVNELDGTTRTYLRLDTDWALSGHVDVSAGNADATYYLLGPANRIDCAVSESGDVVWAADLSVYGAARIGTEDVTVSARMVGQFDDPDVGLVYNYRRWYDPRSGQYVSPDPILLDGGTTLRAYTPNPLAFIDPLGLGKVSTGPRKPSPGATSPVDSGSGGPPYPGPGKRPAAPTSTANMDHGYMNSPGHYARNGDPPVPGHVDCKDTHMNKSGNWPKSVTGPLDKAGVKYGCHLCGSKTPGGPGWPADVKQPKHFVPDHVPPTKTYTDRDRGHAIRNDKKRPWNGSVSLYPSCHTCSGGQGGLNAHASDAQKARVRRRNVAANRHEKGLSTSSPRR